MSKACNKCGVDKPLAEFYTRKGGKHGKNAQCKDCINEYQRNRYQSNPEIRAEHSRRVSLHRQKPEVKALLKERVRLWNQRPEVQARKRENERLYRLNPQVRERQNVLARIRLQAPEVKAKYARYAANRRARKLGNGGVLTMSLVEIVERQGGRCFWCSKPFTKSRKATLDHHIPLSKGGAHSDSNVTATCWPCNQSKKAKPPAQFARERGMLFAPGVA